MEFKFREIESKDGKGENVFYIPPFVYDGKTAYEDFLAAGYALASFKGDEKYKLSSEYSYYDIQESVVKHKRIATVRPTSDEADAIKTILSMLKPKDEEMVYIGQLLFDGFVDGKGFSIFCSHGYVGIMYGQTYLGCKLGGAYKKTFKPLEWRNGMSLKKATYPEIIKATTKLARAETLQTIDANIRQEKINAKGYLDKIKASKALHKESVAALKKLKQVEPTLPAEVVPLLAEGAKKAKNTIATMNDYGKLCRSHTKKAEEHEAEKAFVKGSSNAVENDFKAINKLLKKGYIESIVYEGSKGLSWVFPPMTYAPRKSGVPKEVFLGRVKVTLLEKRGARGFLDFAPISYATTDSHMGTWHFGHGVLCLGSFKSLFDRLVACGAIAPLIHVTKDFIMNANPASPVMTPDWARMDIKGPAVIDDSFTVWNKNKELAAK